MITYLALVLTGIALITDLLLVILWLVNLKEDEAEPLELPAIDILIAARDEETNIARCLDSLLALDYPADKLSVWVGDDDSTDRTLPIIKQYEEKYAFVHGMPITEHVVKGNAKANVLAQLARKGKGEWLFITDADIAVPHGWIKAMLGVAQKNKLALVTGTSLVEGAAWIARFQHFEWLYATTMLKVVSDLGVQVSTMGNNMTIRRDVYEELGGYENIPFSVTEDLELFKQVKKKYATRNLFSADVLNKSVPQTSFIQLLNQRKRWMRGAFQLPIFLFSILVIQAVFFPAVIALMVLNPLWGFSVWLAKWLTKYVFLRLSSHRLKEKLSIFDSFIMEWCSMFFSMATLVYYFWPGKIKWKGRTY